MSSEPDPPRTRVRPGVTTPATLRQSSGARHADEVATSLAGRELLHQLSGPDELLVLHAGRFDNSRGLLQTWLDSPAAPRTGLACVLDPGPAISEGAYWARLHASLHRAHPSSTCCTDGADAFATVLGCLALQTEPVVLVLDDLHLVPHAVDRVESLLQHGSPHGLRIIVSTRTDTGWSGGLTRSPIRRHLPPTAFRVDAEDVSRHLRGLRLRFDVRAAEIICRLSGGLPTLAAAVCASAPVGELAWPRQLDEYIPAIIDREVERVIADEAELAARRRVLLLSAAADPLTLETLALAPLRDDGAQDLFDVLERSGMAATIDDPSGARWAYPEVVRESLLRIAERSLPGELATYREVLIRHWLDSDRAHDALRVAAGSGDWHRVTAILHAHSDTLYTRDFPLTMNDEILALVPEHLVVQDPFLRRLRTLHHQFNALRDAAAPSETDDDNDDDDNSPNAELGVRELVLHAISLRIEGRYSDSADLCDEITARAEYQVTPTSVEDRDSRAFGWVHIGNSYFLAGRFDQAISAWRRAFQLAAEPFIHRDAAGKLALVHALLGDTREADSWLAEERRHPALPDGTEALVRPAGDVAAALLALDRLDIDAAAEILDDLGPPADREEFWGLILYARGELALLDGHAAATLRFVEKDLLRFSTMRDGGGLADPLLDAVRADLHLTCDRAPSAKELLANSRHIDHPLTAPARARAQLLANEPSAALSIALAERSEPRTTTRHAQELDLVAAAASLALGDADGARRLLESAVATYRVTNSLLPFSALPAQVMRRLAALGPELPVDVPEPGAEFGNLVLPSPVPASPAPGVRHRSPGRSRSENSPCSAPWRRARRRARSPRRSSSA